MSKVALILMVMKPKILIGTSNIAKLEKWQIYLADLDTVSPQELGLELEVVEGMTSLIENSQKKARMFARASGLMTLSDDSGFYIPELGGLPGIAIRRWAGKFPDTISDEDWFAFFKQQIASLKDTSCYFEFAVSVALSDGQVKTLTHRVDGYIDKDRLGIPLPKMRGYPIGMAFIREGATKPWQELTPEEKRNREQDFVKEVIRMIHSMQ